ncbi:MAG TPA: hypothetical protein VMS30_10425 [Phycisphaerales bacterium]|nr:hypothetical protein [Phycisphaerales bacterium]
MPMTGGTGAGGSGKTCAVCGEDVSSKPRTKDAKGRYFCQPCYLQALDRKHARREGAPPSPKALPASSKAAPAAKRARDATGMIIDDDADMGGAGGGANMLEQLLDLEPAHEAPALICPACRSKIPPGGFLCTVCGFNTQTNEQGGSVKVKKQRQPGGAVWPWIVGIASMVFGGAGALLYGLYFLFALFGAMKAGVLGAALVSVVPIGSLLTGLAMWLFRDGLRIVRHNSEGVKWIRYWAMAKLLIYGSCLGVLMSIPPGPMEQRLETLPGGTDLTVADIKSTILLIMLWYLLWPAFVMVFFFIPRITADVEAWD